MVCKHKWKIIRTEIGKEHFFFTTSDIMIYHLQCKKCGDVGVRTLGIACRKCKYKISEKNENK